MAKTKWIILLVTFLLSTVSVAFLIVAFATTNWINAEATIDPLTPNSIISYGLFSGVGEMYSLFSPFNVDFEIVCDFSEGVCAYSCQTDPDKRAEELKSLLTGQEYSICPVTNLKGVQSALDSKFKSTILTKATVDTDKFMNAGLFISSVLFLSLTLLFAFLSACFAMLNSVFNPTINIFSTFGLYIWNGVASCCAALTMILYGSLYAAQLSENIAITDTLRQTETYNSKGLASLGFSYWIIIVVIFLHAANMGLIYFRTYLINKEPPPPVVTIKPGNDQTILLY